MPALVHNTGVLARMLSRLPNALQGKPRIASLIKAWANEIQLLEDNIFAIYAQRVLNQTQPTGDLLVKLGAIVGQPFEGLSDDQFRALIRARILANRSAGQRPSLLAILTAIVPGAPIYIKNLPPASVYVELRAQAPLTPYLIAQKFEQPAASAGVQLMFSSTSTDYNDTLIFGDAQNSFTPLTTQALSDVGGHFNGGLDGCMIGIQGGSV